MTDDVLNSEVTYRQIAAFNVCCSLALWIFRLGLGGSLVASRILVIWSSTSSNTSFRLLSSIHQGTKPEVLVYLGICWCAGLLVLLIIAHTNRITSVKLGSNAFLIPLKEGYVERKEHNDERHELKIQQVIHVEMQVEPSMNYFILRGGHCGVLLFSSVLLH